MIRFVSTTLLPDRTWQFSWTPINAPTYRVVLQGRELAVVTTTTYVFNGVGDYSAYPPPLEIVPDGVFADSENDKPFVVFQWYGNSAATRYELQEYVDGNWLVRFQIQEIGATVYTTRTASLDDGSSHQYRIATYNEHDIPNYSTELNMTMITPPTLNQVTIAYNSGNLEISI